MPSPRHPIPPIPPIPPINTHPSHYSHQFPSTPILFHPLPRPGPHSIKNCTFDHSLFTFHLLSSQFFLSTQKNLIFSQKSCLNIWWVRKKVVTLHSLSEKRKAHDKKSFFERLEQRRERQGSAPCVFKL